MEWDMRGWRGREFVGMAGMVGMRSKGVAEIKYKNMIFDFFMGKLSAHFISLPFIAVFVPRGEKLQRFILAFSHGFALRLVGSSHF